MATRKSNLFSRMERAYSRALLETAESAGVLDDVADEVRQLRQLVAQHKDVVRLLSSRSVAMTDRLAAARRLFEGRVSDLTLRFVLVLVRRNRFGELAGIAAAFNYMVEQKHGQIEAEAAVAHALDDASLKRVADRLGAHLNRQVLLEQHVDPAMIGGLKLRIGDEIFDGSVATQLQLMRQKLVADGREKARQVAASL